MGIFKMGVIVIVAFVIISLILEHLITTNKIKASKVSKIFYADNEGFIKSWEKTREKGMLIFVIKNVVISTIVMGIIGMYFLSSYGYDRSETLSDALLVGFNFGLIFSVLQWFVRKNRYKQLKEKI